MARVIVACAVLAGLFFMHGLPTQGCHGGAGMSPSSMTHSMVATVAGGSATPAGAMATQFRSEVGAAAEKPGALCVSTPPPMGWAGLLALLLSLGVVGLAAVWRSPDAAVDPRNQRLRAPPLAGTALLTSLCVSRR